MANRRRTIEIWDNYWKELPTLVYLIFMLSIAVQMILVFMGGMLFFKATWLWALLVALGTGILVYIISYLMIQAKADIQHKRGLRISFFLAMPYASLVFFGGMAACNHWGYRDIQMKEFQQNAQKIEIAKDEILTAFQTSKELVVDEVINQCQLCSNLATSTKRENAAAKLVTCLETNKAQACANFDSSVGQDLRQSANQRISASSNALMSLQDLVQQIDNGGLAGQINQYAIQSGLQNANSDLEQASRKLAESTAAFSECVPSPFSFPTSFQELSHETDCSSPTNVFCAGYGWKPMLLLLGVILGSLLAPLFTEGWADGANSSNTKVEDSFTQGL